MPNVSGLPPLPPRYPRPAAAETKPGSKRSCPWEPGDAVWFKDAFDGLSHPCRVHCVTYAGGDRLHVVVRITDGSLRRAPAESPDVTPR